MSILTYAQALAIANDLSAKTTKPALMLNELVKRTKRAATFIIMRCGDPANWRKPPQHLSPSRGRKTVFGKTQIEGPFTFRHLETGRTVTGNTSRELATKIGLEDTINSQNRVNHVLHEQHHSVDGWYLAPTLDAKVELKDQYGNQYDPMTVRELSLKRGLTPQSILALATGAKPFFKGLALKSTEIQSDLRPRNWRFVSLRARHGSRNVRAKSVPELATKLGVAPADLYQMIYGFKTRPDIELTDIQIERKTALPVVA